jgi:hypothetical protein
VDEQPRNKVGNSLIQQRHCDEEEVFTYERKT